MEDMWSNTKTICVILPSVLKSLIKRAFSGNAVIVLRKIMQKLPLANFFVPELAKYVESTELGIA